MRGKFMQSKKSHTAAKFVRPSTLEALESRTLLSTYYVSTQGNDGAAGSSSSPWRTLQQAANMVRAGDNVIVQAGTYSGFQLTTDGTASARITFQAQPGVLINNRNSSTQDGINLEGASYVTIDGFKIAPASGVTMRSGIRAVESTGVIIRNNNIDRPSWWGIVTGFAENVLIEGNTTTNSINQHGIYVGYGADNPIVRNNISYGNKQCGIQLNSDATGGGDGIITGAIIEGNTVYNNSVGGGAGLNFDGVSNSTVRNNLFYNNSSNAIALYQVDGTQGARNNVIVNNTIVQPNTGYYAVSIVSGSSASSGNKVFNNILIGRSGAIGIDSASRSGFVSDYNAVNDKLSTDASSPISFSSWRSATGQDAHSFIGSTTNLFANYSGNDYHLATSSPAVDTGTSNSAPVTDKDGKARPAGAGYDIGAYEYNGSTPTATAPAAPSALTATAASTSQIALKWTDNSSNETGFLIERATGTGSFTQIASVGAGVTSFTDSGLTASTAYSYRVRATNAAGNSAYSNTAAATTQASTPTVTIPSAPSALTATAASSSQINLKWTDNSNNETGFLIERATGTGTFTQIASVGAGVTSFTSSGLTASTAYSYRVRATNSAGNSAYSNTASATTQASTPTTTIPTAPSALAATAVSSSQVALKWTDNSSNESGFLVERATGTGTFTQIASVGAGVTSFTDSGLAASTAYSYRVRATNS
ncbi:MAG: fibronectin type III domain-containing protein, partial [Bacillota bacterium]